VTDEKIVVVVVEIRSCRKCGEFSMWEVRHWLLEPEVGYEYTCNKAERLILPSDGVNPPPIWCPIRPSN